MDINFYSHWLSIGTPESRYTGSYDTVQLGAAEGDLFTETVSPKGGVYCRYANPLRNGNCYTDLKLPEEQKITVRQFSERGVMNLLNCGRNFLAILADGWGLYAPGADEPLAEGKGSFLGPTPFCHDSGFFLYKEAVRSFDLNGKLLGRLYLTAGSDLHRHEVALIDGMVICAAYITTSSMADGLPGNIGPAVQLESAPFTSFQPPPDPDDFWDSEQINLLAFAESESIVPAYVGGRVIQPFKNHIGIFSLDLKVERVISGEFLPQSVAVGANSVIYMVANSEEGRRLIALDIEGRVGFDISVPETIGPLAAPPMVAKSGDIYLVGKSGIIHVQANGEVVWSKGHRFGADETIFPLLYNDNLTIAGGGICIGYKPDGDILFEVIGLGGEATSPMLCDQHDNYYVGTDHGIVGVAFE